MKVYSKEKNPFQRSVVQSMFRNFSGNKDYAPKSYQENDKWIKIGKYKIMLDEVLGKGYSSKVYKGVEQGKELKRYAIKVIQLKNFSHSCIKLFERQIEIHRTLKHDNIVRCYDVFKTKTHIYMVMEYCPHGDLSSYIHQKRKLSEHIIIDIMTQIINGYKYLANLGIIHRDLKPPNVLRSGKIWKISDFGFSIKSNSFVDQMNVGTPLYMPIQSLSRSYYSVKTDIFALGIILYQLIHSRTPWQCQSQMQLMKKLTYQKIAIEKQIKNTKIKEFILKSCEIQQKKRLSKLQLDDFDFNSDGLNSTRDSTNTLFTHFRSYSLNQSLVKNDYISSNNQILLSYLNNCKFVYYMIQHINSFALPNEKKQIFLMVLLKYLLKIIKMIGEGNFASQRLIQFDQYKTKDQYSVIQDQIQQNLVKYEKTYLDYIKTTNIKTIRQVNSMFQQFTHSSQFLSIEFYNKLKLYLEGVVKQNNQMIYSTIQDISQEQNLNQKLEAFQNLIIFYKHIDSRAKGQSLNFTFNTLTDYGSSKLQKVDYLNLRKEVKHL